MEVLLSSLNAKYIHTNLAIRYLKAYCKDIEDINIKIQEFTINDSMEKIVSEIYKKKMDLIALSCYIWNIEETIKLVKILKKVQPQIKIILGGPEVTFYGQEWMRKVQEIDFIIKGEGEETLYEFLKTLKLKEKIKFHHIKGLLFREKGKIVENTDRVLMEDLDRIPFPYEDNLMNYKNKIIYYESTRGCPFNCQYCLSSTIKGVRYFSLNRVKNELKLFINAGIKQVKFIDRTFNCNIERTKELVRFIIEQKGTTNFHFEIAADLIDEEILSIFKNAPVGLFQLEIGVQSTYLPTLKAIKRHNDFNKIKDVVNTIRSYDNIHQHIDLIAGLPLETYERFKKTFNDVYSLKPDMLQLGFLKILKGAGIEVEEHDYKITPFPPYEVLSNKYITYGEILQLKSVENLVEKYSNSHKFENTIDYILKNYFHTPFEFFRDFALFWEEKNLFLQPHSQKQLYKIFLDYWETKNKDCHIIHEILKFDYLLSNNSPMPTCFTEHPIKFKKEKSFEFVKVKDNVEKYFPEFIDKSPKEIYKRIHFELFNTNILEIVKHENNFIKDEKQIILFYFPEKQMGIYPRAKHYKIQYEDKKL